MKRTVLTALLTLAAVLCHAQAGSRIETGKTASRILGTEKEYSIYLPAGYGTDGPIRYSTSCTGRATPGRRGRSKAI